MSTTLQPKDLAGMNDALTGATRAEAPARSFQPGGVDTCKVQCGRCLNTMEIAPERVRRHVTCTRCQRRLRLPRAITVGCRQCSWQGRFAPDRSGRRVRCPACSTRLRVPVQVARPAKRRHRHGSSSRSSTSGSLIPLTIALGTTILGLMLCFRLLATL